jgi:hypothetical protein
MRVMEQHVTIDSRFCGPPWAGNGGYSCGLAAAGMEGVVEVTLRLPPPLGRALRIARGKTVVLHDGDDVVVEARPASLALDAPPAPSFESAEAMSRRSPGFASHPFPSCFVCGPARAPGEGLRIFPGRAPENGLVGAPWIPDPSLAGPDGRVSPEFLWAALDCPGYFAIAAPGERAVLGRMTAEVEPVVSPGEPCVVVGWPIGRSGRKLVAGTALYDASGAVRGRSLQTWITINPEEGRSHE